ncbi:hypothetical protein ACFLRM_06865 [Acidobacteriota bacterium]
MKKEQKIKAGALLLFALITLLQLFPLSVNPADSVHDLGDPMLNTWIQSWVQNHLFSNPITLFNANIFYPLSMTLSFSEHLFPQAIISLPVYFLFNNPVLAYNFIFLLSYILNAYAMFLLVSYLTKNDMAGIICGIIFSFNTYHLDHIPQLQLVSSWMFPLSLLYLHKYFEDKSIKNSILFSLFFTLQALACIYYGLFFISILIIIFPILLVFYRKEINSSFLIKLGIPLLFSGLILFLFSLPYLQLFKNHVFQRGLSKGADIINYLAPIRHNIFLGKSLSVLGSAEHFLFPGIVAILSAVFYVFFKRRVFKLNSKAIEIPAMIFISINLFLIVLAALTAGFSINLGFWRISANNLAKPAAFIFVTGMLYFLLSFLSFTFRQKEQSRENRFLFLYVFLLLWTYLLSLGSDFSFMGDSLSSKLLPFKWFYNNIPGFKGIRVPSRYGIFVIFSIAILAGYGINHLFARLKRKETRVVLACLLILFLNLEYLTIPKRIVSVPVKKEIPPTYRWLKEKGKDSAITEVPFMNPRGKETVYMYFSIFHKAQLVNGYSGFIPPSYNYIRNTFSGFPSRLSIDILKSLGIKYIVIHPKLWKEEIATNKIQRIQDRYKADLRLVQEFNYTFRKKDDVFQHFGKDLIYEVIADQQKEIESKKQDYQEIPPVDWEIFASTREDFLPHLKDKNLQTRWSTGRAKKPKDFLLVCFKEPIGPTKISLHLGNFINDFAVDLRVDASIDGKKWSRINYDYSAGEFAKNLIYNPRTLVQNVYLKKRKVKYLKIIQLGSDKTFWWSVAELKIYKSAHK